MKGHLELEPDCMMLTLGKDPTWILYDGPMLPIYMVGGAVYVDGALYCWRGISFCTSDLIAFSFQDEAFQVIGPPPRTSTTLDKSDLVMVKFRGQVAVAQEKKTRGGVVYGLVDCKLELWVLEQSTPLYEWIYQVINIPHDFPVGGFSFLGNLPSAGEMLSGGFATDKSVVPVHSYDRTTGKFEEFIAGEFPSSPCPAAASVR